MCVRCRQYNLQLDVYQTLTGLLRSSSIRQNVHLLTCVALLRSSSSDGGSSTGSQGQSVPLNCTLIQLLAELFECTLHDGRTWTIEMLEKDIASPFSGLYSIVWPSDTNKNNDSNNNDIGGGDVCPRVLKLFVHRLYHVHTFLTCYN